MKSNQKSVRTIESRGNCNGDEPIHYPAANRGDNMACGTGQWNTRFSASLKLVTCKACLEKIKNKI